MMQANALGGTGMGVREGAEAANGPGAGMPGPGAPPASQPASASPLANSIQQTWESANAAYAKLKESDQRMKVVRGELDSLSKLQDTVTHDQVIEAAGKMVGAGLSPKAMAELLATMPPQEGEALAQWVAQHDAMVAQQEAALAQQVQGAAIHRGLAAMTHLHMQHQMGEVKKEQMAGAPETEASSDSTEPASSEPTSSPSASATMEPPDA